MVLEYFWALDMPPTWAVLGLFFPNLSCSTFIPNLNSKEFNNHKSRFVSYVFVEKFDLSCYTCPNEVPQNDRRTNPENAKFLIFFSFNFWPVLVSAILKKKVRLPKCPTLTVTFFSDHIPHTDRSFFREIPETTKAKSGQCKLSAKGPPFIFFYFFKVSYKTGRD